MPGKLRRILRTIWICAGLGFTIWIVAGFQSVELPPGVLLPDTVVRVVAEPDGGWSFLPTGETLSPGLIFLPGGMVDPAAYAPLLKRIAAAGHPTRLLPLPMRCACTDGQTSELFQSMRAFLASNPSRRWVLAGHSRGAMLAARFVREEPTLLAGLALLGSTHPRDFSLANLTIPVLKVYASRDGIAAPFGVLSNKPLLPQHTTWSVIEGGNHVQFGYYRHQFGDHAAAISREQQQSAVEGALRELLASPNLTTQR